MIDSRSAMLVLIACILVGAPSSGSTISDHSNDRAASRTTANLASYACGLHSSLPARPATLSRFTPWRTRIKSVLAETYQRIIDEGDLGVAILPGHLCSFATRELVSRPLPIRSPLRC